MISQGRLYGRKTATGGGAAAARDAGCEDRPWNMAGKGVILGKRTFPSHVVYIPAGKDCCGSPKDEELRDRPDVGRRDERGLLREPGK